MRNITTLRRYAIAGIHGAEWYTRAVSSIDHTCKLADLDHHDFAGLLAVTSPRVSVRRNIRIALFYQTFGELPDGIIRTVHTSVSCYIETGAINGQKTSAFAANLRGDVNAVTLDTWMAYALGIEQKTFANKRVRETAAKRVYSVAAELDLSPAAAQAAIWTGYRALAGFSYVDFPVLDEYLDSVKNGAEYWERYNLRLPS